MERVKKASKAQQKAMMKTVVQRLQEEYRAALKTHTAQTHKVHTPWLQLCSSC